MGFCCAAQSEDLTNPMNWLVFATGAILFFAAQDIMMRVLAIKSDHSRIFSFVFNIWGAFFALIAFILQGGSFTQLVVVPPSTIWLIGLAVLLYGLYERVQFIARKGIDASSLTVIYQLSPVIGFLGALLFLNEQPTPLKLVGATLTIGSSLLLVYKNPKLRINRPVIYAFVCAILLGLASVVDKPASAELPSTLYSFLIWVLPLGVIAFPRIDKKQFLKEFRIGGWKVALTALLNVLGFMCFIQALTLTDATRVIPIIYTSSIFTVLGGIFLLGERDHISRKILAAVIALIGIALLT